MPECVSVPVTFKAKRVKSIGLEKWTEISILAA